MRKRFFIPENAPIFRPPVRRAFKWLTSRAYIKLIGEMFNRTPKILQSLSVMIYYLLFILKHMAFRLTPYSSRL
jgi:hypothetical protein